MPETDVPFPMSQCHDCVHLRRVPTKRDSVYLQCTEPPRAFYPRQPVQGCPVFRAKLTKSDHKDGGID